MPSPKLKGTMSQEWPNRSGRLHNSRKIIKNILIQPKLPPHSISRIMYKPNPLIGQIRQPPSIGGCQVSNTPFIEISQRGGGPSSIYERTHGRIITCITCTQIPICSSTKTKSFVKELNSRMPKQLQSNPTKSQRKIRCKLTTEIGDNLRTRMIPFLGKANRPLRQMPSTTLPQQML